MNNKNNNDRRYTLLCDIENELQHYTRHFDNKKVLCFHIPGFTKFEDYFKTRFNSLNLRGLVSVVYGSEECIYIERWERAEDNSITKNIKYLTNESGCKFNICEFYKDYRVLKLYDEVDIVASNIPFRLAQTFVLDLIKRDKKFITVGDLNLASYPKVLPLLINESMWVGYNRPGKVINYPTGEIENNKNRSNWYQNFERPQRGPMKIKKTGSVKREYKRYDNYPEAIEVSRIEYIPQDYTGLMGVPISFFNVYNPEEYEVIGKLTGKKTLVYNKKHKLISTRDGVVNGKNVYTRLLVRKIVPKPTTGVIWDGKHNNVDMRLNLEAAANGKFEVTFTCNDGITNWCNTVSCVVPEYIAKQIEVS